MSFICPTCTKVARVKDTRRMHHEDYGNYIYRRHICPKKHKFSTFEYFAERGEGAAQFTVGAVTGKQRDILNSEISNALMRIAKRIKKSGVVE